MKKFFLLTLLMGILSIPVFAQNDAFFHYGEAGKSVERESTSFGIEGMAFGINSLEAHQDLPVGGGLVLLAGAGLIYAFVRRKEELK